MEAFEQEIRRLGMALRLKKSIINDFVARLTASNVHQLMAEMQSIANKSG